MANFDIRSMYPTMLTSESLKFMKEGLLGKKEQENEPTTEPEEKWVWVTGFKGTDKNMICRDYQFELGKQFDMPEDATIKDCVGGFHLCLKLKDVFDYYGIGNGHRFFVVRALVREKDFEEYGKTPKAPYGMYNFDFPRTKLAAKSIEFIRELTIDEIFAVTDHKNESDEFKAFAIHNGIEAAKNICKVKKLVELGYSEAFSIYVVETDHYNAAVALASQPGLSMDVKALLIFRNDFN